MSTVEYVQDRGCHRPDSRVVVVHAVPVVRLAEEAEDAALHVETDPVVLDRLVDERRGVAGRPEEDARLAGNLRDDVQPGVRERPERIRSVGVGCHAGDGLVRESPARGIRRAAESDQRHVQELARGGPAFRRIETLGMEIDRHAVRAVGGKLAHQRKLRRVPVARRHLHVQDLLRVREPVLPFLQRRGWNFRIAGSQADVIEVELFGGILDGGKCGGNRCRRDDDHRTRLRILREELDGHRVEL